MRAQAASRLDRIIMHILQAPLLLHFCSFLLLASVHHTHGHVAVVDNPARCVHGCRPWSMLWYGTGACNPASATLCMDPSTSCQFPFSSQAASMNRLHRRMVWPLRSSVRKEGQGGLRERTMLMAPGHQQGPYPHTHQEASTTPPTSPYSAGIVDIAAAEGGFWVVLELRRVAGLRL